MAKSTVAVRFTGDTADLKRSLDGIDGKLKSTGSKLASFGKVAAVGLGGLAVGGAALAKGFVDAAVESQKVTKQTEAVIKSMGGASNVTAQQVANLSESLAMQTGVDDELIQAGQNVLLTFGNVQNAIGDGPKIFDRATQAALDMSVALGTDMTSASMQVGKALNDPVAGLTKLRRSGIQFTKQQEDQIKAMVEAGDTAGAQAVMLKELERQFGGSAEAQATAGDKLKVVWGNLQETLGEKLLPVVEKVSRWLADNLPKALKSAEDAFRTIQPWIAQVVATVREHWPEIQATITRVIDHVRKVIKGFIDTATTLWNNFGNNILEFVQRVWPRIQQIIQGVMNVIQGVIKTVTSLIKGDWSQVWEGIKQIFSGVWTAIQGILGTALETLRTALGVGLEIIGSMFKGAWNGLVQWFAKIPGRLGEWAGKAWEAIKEGLADAVNWVIRQIDRMLGPIDEALAKIDGLKEFALGGATHNTAVERAARAAAARNSASGAASFPGGLSWVGEHGKELVRLPQGTQVFSHARSMAMAGGGGGVVRQPIILTLDGRVIAEAVAEYDTSQARNNGFT